MRVSRVPELRLVSKYGVGLDMIDLDAARRHGVAVRWTPGVNRQAVAELTIAFMIAPVPRRRSARSRARSKESWRQPGGRQLSSAIVGVDRLRRSRSDGRAVVQRVRRDGARARHPCLRRVLRETGVTPVSLDALLDASDIVTIHLPLDATTRGLIDARALGLMKPTAFLVNTARGGDRGRACARGRARRGAACRRGRRRLLGRAARRVASCCGCRTSSARRTSAAAREEAALAMGRAAIAGLDGGGRIGRFDVKSLTNNHFGNVCAVSLILGPSRSDRNHGGKQPSGTKNYFDHEGL